MSMLVYPSEVFCSCNEQFEQTFNGTEERGEKRGCGNEDAEGVRMGMRRGGEGRKNKRSGWNGRKIVNFLFHFPSSAITIITWFKEQLMSRRIEPCERKARSIAIGRPGPGQVTGREKAKATLDPGRRHSWNKVHLHCLHGVWALWKSFYLIEEGECKSVLSMKPSQGYSRLQDLLYILTFD